MTEKEKDTKPYKHFLLCNHLANVVLGHKYQNFAKLIADENDGRFANAQMTGYFYVVDEQLSDLECNSPLWVFEWLDEEEVAEIEAEQLQADYEKYCAGNLIISWTDRE